MAENNFYLSNEQGVSPDSLPHFAHPPVTEVALSLQFEPLANLKGPVIGLLWSHFKDTYPGVEEHSPIETVIEKFGGDLPLPNVRFEVLKSLPPTRVWFLNKNGTELVQVQQDRFIHNWRRRTAADQYPRYSFLRRKLIDELEIFQRFIVQEQLGSLRFNQVEVTFVNTILSGEGWERHGQLESVLTIHRGKYSDDFFSEPENVQTSLRYLIPGKAGKPVGRLHINVIPIVSLDEKKPAFNLTITARCTSDGMVEDTIRSLDLAHQWVVKGFASITTKEMHRIWGRQE